MSKPIENLDWDDLRVFLVAVRSHSVSGAAKQLSISHSTVSRRLAKLEYAVGAGLFERSRDGLSLTATGAQVLRYAEDMAEALGKLKGELGGGGGDASGTVRIATMEGIASLFFAPRLNQFTSRHRNLHLELVTSPQNVRVARREADLFLSFFKPRGQGMSSECVGAFSTGLYASPEYLNHSGAPKTPADLTGHNFIGYIEELVMVDEVRWLDELVEHPRLCFTSNSMIAHLAAAKSGAGLVALPSFAVPHDRSLLPVLPQLRGRREIWITVHQDMQSTPRVRTVMRFLKELVESELGE